MAQAAEATSLLPLVLSLLALAAQAAGPVREQQRQQLAPVQVKRQQVRALGRQRWLELALEPLLLLA